LNPVERSPPFKTARICAKAGLLAGLGLSAHAREFELTTDRDDTLATVVRQLKPGDVCRLRGGTYRRVYQIDSLRGSADNPIIITAFPGETVVFDGSDPVDSSWQPHGGGIYKTRLKADGWQLFFNGRTMTTARFPDASWEDGSLWNLTASCRHVAAGSKPGVTVDQRPPKQGRHAEGYDEGHVLRTLEDDSLNRVSLAASGIDFTGATAILHIGSWLSWAQEIRRHKKGADTFTYDPSFSRSGEDMAGGYIFRKRPTFFETKNIKHGEGYYFIEGLQCLDRPGEWFYTPQDRMLYFYPPAGTPQGDVRIKRRTYSLILTNCEHVVVRGLRFFGSTFRLENCRSVRVEDCDLLYPSYNRIVLGEFQRPAVTGIYGSNSVANTVLNCRFEQMDGPGLELEGISNTVENCLFAEVDYTCLGTGGEGTLNMRGATNSIVRRNTIHTTGNSEGIRCGPGDRIELNHVYNMSLIQHDGSQINVGVRQQDGTVLRKNWSHDSLKSSLRFDSTNMGNPKTVNYGVNGTMIRNVMWNSGPMKIKGEHHRIIGNTGIDGVDGPCVAVLDNHAMGGFNLHTLTVNNFGALSGSFVEITPVPGKASHNRLLKPRQTAGRYLRDPKNLDFRPKAGSALIDAGTPIQGLDFLGRAPDIGAYEYGDSTYWIPGRREAQASMPVPPDGATEVKADADLMWLQARRSSRSVVYFGARPDELERLATVENNIVTPPALQRRTRYFWRVDSRLESGKSIPGPVWAFTTE
jgi:hypothetical protein